MHHDATVSLYIKTLFFSFSFVDINVLIYRPAKFGQRIPSGNAFSELGSIETPIDNQRECPIPWPLKGLIQNVVYALKKKMKKKKKKERKKKNKKQNKKNKQNQQWD